MTRILEREKLTQAELAQIDKALKMVFDLT